MNNLKPVNIERLNKIFNLVDYYAPTFWTRIFRSPRRRSGDSMEQINLQQRNKTKEQIQRVRRWLDKAEAELLK